MVRKHQQSDARIAHESVTRRGALKEACGWPPYPPQSVWRPPVRLWPPPPCRPLRGGRPGPRDFGQPPEAQLASLRWPRSDTRPDRRSGRPAEAGSRACPSRGRSGAARRTCRSNRSMTSRAPPAASGAGVGHGSVRGVRSGVLSEPGSSSPTLTGGPRAARSAALRMMRSGAMGPRIVGPPPRAGSAC
jgi:hypothetical protein